VICALPSSSQFHWHNICISSAYCFRPATASSFFRYSTFNQNKEKAMNLRNIQRSLMASAVTVLAFGAAPAMASTPFGTCTGTDCVTATGHASVSVTSTLTINEQRAISFGNMSASTGGAGGGDASIALGLDGSRTITQGAVDTITLLHGANSSNGAGSADGGGPGTFGSGAQSPGHYTVEADAEGGTTQVYISFADATGVPIDISGDDYHHGKSVSLTGPVGRSFTMDKFVINETGSDVYGHYISNTAPSPSPGTTDPFDHTHAANAADLDVVVGATLHTVSHAAGAYAAGKYTGTFNIMTSY
jgi:hypothetical protein